MTRHWLETERNTSFAQFDGKLVSVVLKQGRREVVWIGLAMFQRDDRLGNILRIEPSEAQPGSPHLILSESEWSGRIIPDLHHGAVYSFIPTDTEQGDDATPGRKKT